MSGIWITLSNKAELGWEDSDHPDCPPRLKVRTIKDVYQHFGEPRIIYEEVKIGSATKENIDQIKDYLDRLRIHCE